MDLVVVLGVGGEAEPRRGDQPVKAFAMSDRWGAGKRRFTSVDALNPRFMATSTPNSKGKSECAGRSVVTGDPFLLSSSHSWEIHLHRL